MKPRPERRRDRRLPIRLPVVVAVDDDTAVPSVLIDITRHGMFVKAVANVDVGAAVAVSLTLQRHGECTATGRVVRKSEVRGLEGFGVEFDTTSPELDRFTADLEQLPRSRWKGFLAEVLEPLIEVRAAPDKETD